MTAISRRLTIAALASSVAAPATIAAPLDPALDLVLRYRAGMAAFNQTPETSDHEEEARIVAATYGGPWDEIVTDFPVPLSHEGALATARLLVEEQSTCLACYGQRNMTLALLRYLEGEGGR
ncbi:hypothetical protein [Phreatobacter sp.]|uniref:hypothetical protein n=1 Tax=Phreatobacter sp. TaxID=1966341 RepID=UPI0022C3BF8C|nr:hypothetical protein [Phreatobacter sp.]MCZ8314125.1 hypothetical protein [Phreatobacter sp.]